MRKSFTAVIEKNARPACGFETEPYEAGWAGEALWFVRVLELEQGTVMTCHPQISPDGLFWLDEGTEPLIIEAPGLHMFKLKQFGNWLRLRIEAEGSGTKTQMMIYLTLKE